MDEQKRKDLEMLQSAIAEGDKWLLDQGVVSDLTHNALITGVYVSYPEVRYVEYDMSNPQAEDKWIDMRLYVGFWRLIWISLNKRKNFIIDDCFFNVSEYLKNYSVRITLKLYRGQDKG